MTDLRRQRIDSAFSAARNYDSHARVQRVVAQALARRIATLDLPSAPRVLEIGCGTGFLTEALIDRAVPGEWLVTDLAGAMVDRCRARVGEAAGRRFARLDGEYDPRPSGPPFDLICSSLALQWFDDIPAATQRLRGWLAPAGHLIFTTLTAGTFGEWRLAHQRLGLSPGTPRFPGADTFGPTASAERHVELFASGHEFLRSLKAIGAGTPASRHRPLGPADLRRVIAEFERGSDAPESDAPMIAVTYEVVTCHLRAKEPR
ncbi:MAG: methyltransferase [Pseudomonadota bacterium]